MFAHSSTIAATSGCASTRRRAASTVSARMRSTVERRRPLPDRAREIAVLGDARNRRVGGKPCGHQRVRCQVGGGIGHDADALARRQRRSTSAACNSAEVNTGTVERCVSSRCQRTRNPQVVAIPMQPASTRRRPPATNAGTSAGAVRRCTTSSTVAPCTRSWMHGKVERVRGTDVAANARKRRVEHQDAEHSCARAINRWLHAARAGGCA